MAEDTGTDSDSLAALVAEVLEGLDRFGPRALEDACRAHPQHAGELRRRVAALDRFGLSPSEPQQQFPERLGEYRLLERLGGGGMGVVYLAWQERLRRHVALKVMRPERLYFEAARQRFRREVEVIARLQHPSIVPIHAVGESDGVPYFAMERIRGCTVAELVDSFADRQAEDLRGTDLAEVVWRGAGFATPPPSESQSTTPDLFRGRWVEVCLHIVRDVALALQHAHDHGVLHRDVKPSNVMIDAAGRVLLVDFGLARDADDTQTLTASHAQPGSVPYMSPEQLRGDGDALDHRTDVFSLGVVLYELLTLRHPFRAGDAEATSRRILAGHAEPITAANRAVPQDATTVCLKAIDPDSSRRYASAAAFAEDIARVLSYRPIAARRPGPWLRTHRWAQRHPGLAASYALLSVVVVFGPLVLWLQQRSHSARVMAALREAEGRRLVATSTNLLGSDPTAALLLAIEGASRHRDLAADNALLAALRECHELRTFTDAGSAAVAWVDSGRTLVAGGRDGMVRTWQDGGGAPRLFAGHDGPIRWLALTAAGSPVLTASQDATTRVWDLTEGRCTAVLSGHVLAVRAVAVTADGSRAATCGEDHTVRLWNLTDGTELAVLKGHRDIIYTVAFHPHRTELASASEDRTIRIWNHRTGELVRKLEVEGHDQAYWGAVFWVEYDASGERLAAGYGDGMVRLWHSATGGITAELHGHWREVSRAHFDPAGQRLLTTSFDCTARLWDVGSARCLAVMQDHPAFVVDGAWSPDGKLCATASRDGSIRLWDASGNLRARLDGHQDEATALAFAPDGRRLASASSDGTTRIWRVPPRRVVAAHRAAVRTLAIGRAGRRAVTSGGDAAATVWDPRSWQEIARLRGHDGEVLGAAFDAEARRVVTWSQDRTARVWDAESGRELLTLGDHAVYVGWGAFGDGGRVVLTVAVGVLRLWDAQHGELLGRLDVGKGELLHLPRLSADATRFLATSFPRRQAIDLDLHGPFADVLFVATGGPPTLCLAEGPHFGVRVFDDQVLSIEGDGSERELWRHNAFVRDIAFSDRGHCVAVAYDDGLVRLYRNDVGRILDLRGHQAAVVTVEIDRDAHWILTRSDDGTGRLWSADDGAERMTLGGTQPRVTVAALSADGTRVLSGWSDGTLRSTVIDPDPLATALSRKPRELTAAERASFGIR